MSVFYIGSYDIHDPATFAGYPPGVLALLPRHGGRVWASDTSAHLLEGSARTMNAIIEFPSLAAVRAMYDDPAYQPLKQLRQASTRNTSMVVVKRYG
jgi:uncharacterized protein (DUF1330 family)